MSNAFVLFPQQNELALVNVSALEDRKSIYPFQLSVKKPKTDDLMSLAEKYPFTLETDNGYVYRIVKDGKEFCTIQLSDLTGLEIKGATDTASKKVLPLIRTFLLDEARQLYTALINQLVGIQNNQWFLLLLGLKAKKLVQGEISTINLIDSPQLKIIKGDQWIKLTVEVIEDISWGYFPTNERSAIMDRFKNRLRLLAETELQKVMGVNISAFDKAVDNSLKRLVGVEVDIPNLNVNTEQAGQQLETTQTVNDLPTEPFLTYEDLKLDSPSLLEKIKSVSITAFEAAELKFKQLRSPKQIEKYLKDKQWIIQPSNMVVDTEQILNETQIPAIDSIKSEEELVKYLGGKFEDSEEMKKFLPDEDLSKFDLERKKEVLKVYSANVNKPWWKLYVK